MSSFTHLHVHTEYSTLDGASKISLLVDKAIRNGMYALAITDHGNMYGIKEFFNYVKKKNSSHNDEIKRLKKKIERGDYSDQEHEDEVDEIACQAKITSEQAKLFKPIIGCEVYVARNGRFQKKTKEDERGNHLILLAKNKVGYHNLLKLVSKGWTEGMYYKPRIDKELLQQYKDGLIVASACLAGEVPRYIQNGDIEQAEKSILWFKDLFGEDYYLELQRHKSNDPATNHEVYNRQEEVNKVLLEMSKKHNIKLICTNDVHFVEAEDAEAHDRLLCISTNSSVSDTNRMRYTKQEWFKTPEEMATLFADVPESLTNTMEVADKVETYTIDSSPIMPDFPLPEGFADNEAYFRYLTQKGAKERYGEMTEEMQKRLNYEMDTICSMGFPGYFLIVQDFIAAARGMGVSVGPGRGSAAGSVVAYCLHITEVDPFKYDLLFERFLNPERISMPDIDVDFDDDGRGKVLKWVTDKYGKEKVAHIVTFGTMATKMALKDVARVEQLPLAEADKLTKLIPDRLPDVDGQKIKVNIKNCIKYVPAIKEAYESQDQIMSDTVKYASMLEGTVRQSGVHACGVIIGKDDLTEYVPIATAMDKKVKEEILVTQYEGSVIEEVGLLKMDFLSLSNLTIIQYTLNNIKKHCGDIVTMKNISLDDTKTYELFGRGDTLGTFQFESDGMRKYLRELKPTKFEDLIAMVALYRPGPMDKIPEFIQRKQGKIPIKYDIPIMERYLKDTYGITVYQEQVMLLSQLLADFTGGQADTLRKAMGKKQLDKMAALKDKFTKGCTKNGHDPEIIENIWKEWEKFASYAFNKSHATCYALVSYQTAWLKANYPAEYMAALLSCNLNDITELSKYMEESRRMGIQLLGPDVNESDSQFTVNKDGNIRFGLQGIKGVGEGAVQAIIKERDKNGPFTDIINFVERVSVYVCGKKNMESLAQAGAFDELGIKREQFFIESGKDATFLETLSRYANLYQNDKLIMSGGGLFGDLDAVHISKPEIPYAPEWPLLKKLNAEKELTGIYFSAHPLDPYKIEFKHFVKNKLTDLANLEAIHSSEFTFAGLVVATHNGTTKAGKPWGKLTIEDYSGSFDIVFFGKNYEKFGSYMVESSALWFKATKQKSYRGESMEMKILDIHLLGNVKEDFLKKITIRLPLQDIDDVLLSSLKTSIKANPGKIPLNFIIFDKTEESISVDLFSRNHHVDVNNNLITQLEQLNLDYIIN